jgi:hypothetical protein
MLVVVRSAYLGVVAPSEVLKLRRASDPPRGCPVVWKMSCKIGAMRRGDWGEEIQV